MYSTTENRHLKKFILFAHAFTGCDTTSAIFKKGKKTVIAILKKNKELQNLVSNFDVPGKTPDEIYNVAEEFIKQLYNVDHADGLSIGELRYKIFTSSVVSSAKKELQLAYLPPTKSALREHAKRVYY